MKTHGKRADNSSNTGQKTKLHALRGILTRKGRIRRWGDDRSIWRDSSTKLLHLAVMIVTVFAFGPPASAVEDKTTIFVNVSVIDVERGITLPNMDVAVVGGRIETVGPSRRVEPPEGSIVVKADGKFLIPGLWDMHVHHDFKWTGPLDLALANGITGVRDMNSSSFVLEWRDEIRSGKRRGPRIKGSGKFLDAKMFGQTTNRRTADTLNEGRELVRERKAAGADFIKVYSGLDPEVYRAIVAEASHQGLPVVGHCPDLISAFEASLLGQRSIEHLTGVALASSANETTLRQQLVASFRTSYGYDISASLPITIAAIDSLDPTRQESLFSSFRSNGTWHVPTLIMYRPIRASAEGDPRLKYVHPEDVVLWRHIRARDQLSEFRHKAFSNGIMTVRAMHKAGVRLLAGTDAGGSNGIDVFHGFSLAEELELFVECGLSPAEALRTATLHPALFFREGKTAGTVAPGKRADLVLLDANPLDSIRSVRSVSGVMADGRWFPKSALDELLSNVKPPPGKNRR